MQRPKNPSRRSLPSGLQGPINPGGKYGYRSVERAAKAAELAALRKTRSNEQQLAELDKRLGVGVGARSERRRLAKAK